MKKFTAVVLTFVMVVCMSCVAFASSFDGTTLTVDPSNSNFVTIDKTVFDGHADNEPVVITLTVVNHFSSDPGFCWCYNESKTEGFQWWSNAVSGTQGAYPGDFAADGETTEITFTVGELKGYIAQSATCDGLVLNCWNGIDPTKIVMGSGAPAGDATPVTALAIIALASLAGVVVLRKKEA